MSWTLGGSSGAPAGRWARISGLCCIVLLAALMPSAQAEVAPQEADVTLGYGCQLAPGPRQVSIRVNAKFPSTGVVAQPIQPTDVTVRVTLPPATVADLTEQGVATVAGAVNLATTVAQNGKVSDAAWTGLAVPATSIPMTGGLTLVASGPVPPATVTAPGDVRFTAGVLGLFLTPKKADGSATEPPTMPLACNLSPGQGGHLVTVPVSKSSTPTTSPTASRGPDARPQETRPGAITTGPGAGSLPQSGTGAYEDIDVRGTELCADPNNWTFKPPTLQPASAYLAGYSNARKLDSALTVGYPFPALVKGDGGPFWNPATGTFNPDTRGFQLGLVNMDGDSVPEYQCQLTRLDLDHQGRREFPPARGTFLTFGFMPVTATAHITQVGNEPLESLISRPGVGLGGGITTPWSLVAVARASLRLSDVTVNGVPLDVGGDCRTTEPLTSPESPYRPDRLVLAGGSNTPNAPTPQFSNILFGGAVAGTASIPTLTGCVSPSGEDLDPLLNATISGSANFLKIILGPLCTTAGLPGSCTPDRKPGRVPYWTVSNGGTYTSSSSSALTFTQSRTRITCNSVVSGAVPDTTGPPRGNLGTVRMSFRDCAGSDGSRWQIEQRGIAGMAGNFYDAGPRTMTGKITGVSLRVTGPNAPGTTGPCNAVITGSLGVTYTNPPEAKLTIVAGTANAVGTVPESSNCPGIEGPPSPPPVSIGGSFDLNPAKITITSPPVSEVVGP